MKDNEFVAMEQHQCPICGKLFDTGAVLFHKRCRTIKEEERVTGMSLCPEHKKLHEDGYLTLIGVNNKGAEGRMQFNDAKRTNELVYIKRDVAAKVFNVPIEEDLPFVFVDSEVISMLKRMQSEAQNDA
jgi:hypothetical protein